MKLGPCSYQSGASNQVHAIFAKRNADLTYPVNFYESGRVEEVFRVYMAGYAYGKSRRIGGAE